MPDVADIYPDYNDPNYASAEVRALGVQLFEAIKRSIDELTNQLSTINPLEMLLHRLILCYNIRSAAHGLFIATVQTYGGVPKWLKGTVC